MSKEKVKKDTHQCSDCGRISAAKSVLREVKKKDKEGNVTSIWHCTNSKKCKEDQKAKLVNGKRKKKVVVKKAAAPKKVEEAQATA